MPYRPNKPCNHPPCPKLIPAGQRYCQAHQQLPGMRHQEYDRPARHHFYKSAEWRRFRKEALAQLGDTCTNCGEQANPPHLDHIQRLEDAPDLALDLNNVRVLCGTCHSGRTLRDINRARKP